MILRLPKQKILFPRRPLLMGIVNINDDSFCGDGTLNPQKALAQAREMIQQGADIIAIGAESARTNREPITTEEEVRRLRSFLAHWPQLRDETKGADSHQLTPPLLSVNTWRPEVVAQIIHEHVDILNDISALPDDRNARLCSEHNVALLIMHSVGQPKVSHTHQKWDNLLNDLTTFFEEKIALATQAGLSRQQIILDPGIDFAKQKEDNLLILRELQTITDLGCPVLLPISRKTVIGDVLNLPNPTDRDAGTLALLTHGMSKGAHIFRIHNVQAAWQALRALTPFHQSNPVKKLHLTINLAISGDGKISTASKGPAHFTSKEDLQNLLKIRQEHDAILVGHGTLKADQMTLTAPGKTPWRCVISRSGNIDPAHPLFHSEGGPRHLIIPKNVDPPQNLPATIHQGTLKDFLKTLQNTPEIQTLLCEGGGNLIKELFQLDVVDEIRLTWAPHTILGGKNAPTLTGLPAEHLPSSRHYQLVEMIENDRNELFLTYLKKQAHP